MKELLNLEVPHVKVSPYSLPFNKKVEYITKSIIHLVIIRSAVPTEHDSNKNIL